eukprot:scaffold12367_cov108-Skeletonema_menzelii.AAC.1
MACTRVLVWVLDVIAKKRNYISNGKESRSTSLLTPSSWSAHGVDLLQRSRSPMIFLQHRPTVEDPKRWS